MKPRLRLPTTARMPLATYLAAPWHLHLERGVQSSLETQDAVVNLIDVKYATV
jgi:hypothetical protein